MSFKVDFEKVIQDGNITNDEWADLQNDHSKILDDKALAELKEVAKDYVVKKR